MTIPQSEYRTESKSNKSKKCKTCGETKSVDEFYFANKERGTKSPYCKACCCRKASIHRMDHPRDPSYVSCQRSNVSVKWFWKQIEKQNNLCAICGKPEISRNPYSDGVKFLSIDHNHRTGEIRGLLCHRCNVSITQLDKYGEEWSILALRYLADHSNSNTILSELERIGPENNRSKPKILHCKSNIKTSECCPECQSARREYGKEKTRKLRKTPHGELALIKYNQARRDQRVKEGKKPRNTLARNGKKARMQESSEHDTNLLDTNPQIGV